MSTVGILRQRKVKITDQSEALFKQKRWFKTKTNDRIASRLSTEEGSSGELLHHGRRVGQEDMTEIQVVSGKINLISHIETYQL